MISSRHAVLAASALAASLGGCGLLINYTDYTAGSGGSGTATGTGGGSGPTTGTGGGSSTATGAGGGSSTTGGGGQGGASATSSASSSASASGSSGDSSSSTGQGGGGCNSPDDICFAPPSGWSGPVVYTGGKPCTPGWQVQQMDTEFSVSCSCACGAALAVCTATVTLYSDSGCAQPIQSSDTIGGCIGYGQTITAQGIDLIASPDSTPTCPPQPQGGFSQSSVSLCGPAAPIPCQGGTCVSSLNPGGYCILHPGDVACPAGFGVKHILGDAGTADNRTCDTAQCSCGGSLGSCNATAKVWSNNLACVGANAGFITSNGCTDVLGGGVASVNVSTTPSFSCLAAGTSKPMGTVTGPNTQTLCCPP